MAVPTVTPMGRGAYVKSNCFISFFKNLAGIVLRGRGFRVVQMVLTDDLLLGAPKGAYVNSSERKSSLGLLFVFTSYNNVSLLLCCTIILFL